MKKLRLFHIPVCPFSQRLEILLACKDLREIVDFHVVDITVPRPDWLLEKLNGTTALPALETEDGRILKESLVLLRYLERRFPEPRIGRDDPYECAVEDMLIAHEGDFTSAGYRLVLNQDPARRADLTANLVAQYEKLDRFLRQHAPDGTWLFERFGLAEAVFTPMFMRFWFLGYYEGFAIPERLDRVRRWVDACVAHPAAQQVSEEEIVKVYYDYAKGAGNGALLPNRSRSSFAFEPHWSARPWPPADKYGQAATDHELGLV